MVGILERIEFSDGGSADVESKDPGGGYDPYDNT